VEPPFWARHDVHYCPAGDHGDLDLAAALDSAQNCGRPVAACCFGHMHHRCRGDGALRQRVAVTRDSVVHLNTAVVPRHKHVSYLGQLSCCSAFAVAAQVALVLGLHFRRLPLCLCPRCRACLAWHPPGGTVCWCGRRQDLLSPFAQVRREAGETVLAHHLVVLELQQRVAVAAKDVWVAVDATGGCAVVAETELLRTKSMDPLVRETFDMQLEQWKAAVTATD